MTDKEPKNIIEGFRDDLTSITQKFATCYPKCQLSDFLTLWDEEHMDCLFANRFDPRELIEAISEMNQYLTEVLVSPNEDKMKIVAIYLLLCIYVKQPERFRSKFRWNCKDLITIERWCNVMAENGDNLHPRRALRQLKAFRAFDLVEERNIYGPSMIRRGIRDPEEPTSHIQSPCIAERKETLEFLESKIEPSVSELKSIHATYDRFREALHLTNYGVIVEQASTSISPGVYIDQAAGSITEFKSNLNQ